MASGGGGRLAAIDWLRGLVMVLMTIDHASMHYNGGRVASDSSASYVVGSALPAGQFMLRWVTHLCAPTFVFLAGTALALNVANKQRVGATEATITRELVIRGAIIVLLDLVYMSVLAQHVLLQVLYAIGASMILVALVRTIATRVLLVVALVGIGAGELVTSALWDGHDSQPPLLLALTLVPRRGDVLLVIYPVLPWLWMMLLGWCFGQFLSRRANGSRGPSPEQLLVLCGVFALLLFAVVRGLDGYGNMFLHRDDNSLVQWLHVSKYPPSIAYTALELGLMALLLSALMRLQSHVTVNPNNPLLLFGQTALVFYVLHQFMLGASAMALGMRGKGAYAETFVAAAITLIVLYPVCRKYRSYKQAHPTSWVRWL